MIDAKDLALMSEKGMQMDPDRLKKMAGTIKRQVRRADGIVHRMNRNGDRGWKALGHVVFRVKGEAILTKEVGVRGVTKGAVRVEGQHAVAHIVYQYCLQRILLRIRVIDKHTHTKAVLPV